MSRIPRVTGSDLLAALAKTGFAVLRVEGSHNFPCHEDGRSTVVPVHSGEVIGPGLLTRYRQRAAALILESPVHVNWQSHAPVEW